MSDPIAPEIESPPPSYDEVINSDAQVPSDQPEPTSRPQAAAVRPTQVRVVLGPGPVRCVCANCNCLVTTRVVSQLASWAICGICCLLCCPPLCCVASCLLPFLMDDFANYEDVHHSCPSCGHNIGVYTA